MMVVCHQENSSQSVIDNVRDDVLLVNRSSTQPTAHPAQFPVHKTVDSHKLSHSKPSCLQTSRDYSQVTKTNLNQPNDHPHGITPSVDETSSSNSNIRQVTENIGLDRRDGSVDQQRVNRDDNRNCK